MGGNLTYSDEQPDELIGGKLVKMASAALNRLFTASNICIIFDSYLREKKCRAIPRGVSVFLEEGERFVPDFMVVCDPDKLRQDGIHGTPDLVVEIISPRTGKLIRTHKKDVYGRCGVGEYWIVSSESKYVEQYFLENGSLELREVYSVYPDWMLEGMTEEERAEVVTHFKCSLFDDLDISLADVFDNLLPSR